MLGKLVIALAAFVNLCTGMSLNWLMPRFQDEWWQHTRGQEINSLARFLEVTTDTKDYNWIIVQLYRSTCPHCREL